MDINIKIDTDRKKTYQANLICLDNLASNLIETYLILHK